MILKKREYRILCDVLLKNIDVKVVFQATIVTSGKDSRLSFIERLCYVQKTQLGSGACWACLPQPRVLLPNCTFLTLPVT
jgi:hypothetical protein